MRGVETRIQEIRHRVFREVARMAYHTEWPVDKRIESLPYKIILGEVGNFRNDVFLERAIVGERLRLAMGLPCGRMVLSVAVLGILITAPLGALGMDCTYKKLLTKKDESRPE